MVEGDHFVIGILGPTNTRRGFPLAYSESSCVCMQLVWGCKLCPREGSSVLVL